MNTIALICFALGALILAVGHALEWFKRTGVDSTLNGEEKELNEASKHAANSVSEFERLKRQYDDANKPK